MVTPPGSFLFGEGVTAVAEHVIKVVMHRRNTDQIVYGVRKVDGSGYNREVPEKDENYSRRSHQNEE